MPDQKNIVFEREILCMYKDAQAEVPVSYDSHDAKGARFSSIEEQSACFLDDYISGKAIINNADLDVLKDYLKVLRSSLFPAIKEKLPKAEKKYKIAVILLRKKEEEEKSKKNKTTKPNEETLTKNQFAILHKKKEMDKLSSADLLKLGELLDQVTEYNTTHLKDKLRSYIQTRIEKTFKGELPQDEDFGLLVQKRGSFRQKQRLEKRSAHTNSAVLTPVAQLEPVQSVVELPTTDVPQADPVDDKKTKKSNSSNTLDFPHDKERMEFLRKNQFAILQNKKKAQQLTAIDYLLIAEMLKEEKGYSTKNISDKLLSYAQLRINKVLAGKLPYEEGFDLLISTHGTTTQRVAFDQKKDALIGAATLSQAMDEQSVTSDQEKVEVSHEPQEEKEDDTPVIVTGTPQKLPWYKRLWKYAAAIVVGAVAIFGLAKAPNFFKNSSKDKVSPQTEQNDKTLNNYKTNTEASSTDKKSADFNVLRQKIEEKKAQISASAVAAVTEAQSSTPTTTHAAAVTPVSTDKVTNTPTNELDDDWNKRVDIFKKAQDKLHINLDNLDKVVNDQVKAGNIVLSEKLTEARAKYMISFYAQYPYSEAGQVCNALLNGEKVKVSKDDFNKWNDELGDKGTEFINTLKKNGYTTTTFSPSDYVYYTTTTRDV